LILFINDSQNKQLIKFIMSMNDRQLKTVNL